MSQPSRGLQVAVWGGLALVIAALLLAFLFQERTRVAEPLPVLFSLPDFTLTNQHGEPVGLAQLRGHPWLVDIIFTQCAGPCPEMTQRMAGLQTLLPEKAGVLLVTLTTDPEHDTPAVLQAYARKFNAQPGRWHFLTGSKAQIAELAVGGLKLSAIEKAPGERTNPVDLFIHSTLFVLVDAQARVRATFESDDPEMKKKVIAAVKRLQRETPGGAP
jgi:protein SCO1/2